ncbi:hypothetical protein CONPUDRAFT_81251 [Coniophora puteana RWD-64-598 SS2]|uniref:Uncharacterized protein n=1 Tax=Coniophora puteana (strain RWD-64-598) TaxID=741705 RepID=A0A5M3MVR8_CONPW|nr:uncharacterized protein CONPUDRAFT_81251 [Coniophora puteana RWD-64-598 SS2]EIW83226.1 hypothetical protein CONPUDRAFT_81251 [Coniophora puteana RWD-64-598 SS2]
MSESSDFVPTLILFPALSLVLLVLTIGLIFVTVRAPRPSRDSVVLLLLASMAILSGLIAGFGIQEALHAQSEGHTHQVLAALLESYASVCMMYMLAKYFPQSLAGRSTMRLVYALWGIVILVSFAASVVSVYSYEVVSPVLAPALALVACCIPMPLIIGILLNSQGIHLMGHKSDLTCFPARSETPCHGACPCLDCRRSDQPLEADNGLKQIVRKAAALLIIQSAALVYAVIRLGFVVVSSRQPYYRSRYDPVSHQGNGQDAPQSFDYNALQVSSSIKGLFVAHSVFLFLYVAGILVAIHAMAQNHTRSIGVRQSPRINKQAISPPRSIDPADFLTLRDPFASPPPLSPRSIRSASTEWTEALPAYPSGATLQSTFRVPRTSSERRITFDTLSQTSKGRQGKKQRSKQGSLRSRFTSQVTAASIIPAAKTKERVPFDAGEALLTQMLLQSLDLEAGRQRRVKFPARHAHRPTKHSDGLRGLSSPSVPEMSMAQIQVPKRVHYSSTPPALCSRWSSSTGSMASTDLMTLNSSHDTCSSSFVTISIEGRRSTDSEKTERPSTALEDRPPTPLEPCPSTLLETRTRVSLGQRPPTPLDPTRPQTLFSHLAIQNRPISITEEEM